MIQKFEKKIFKHQNDYTIGVEEEYMICDPITGELINKAEEIFKYSDDELTKRLSYELICSEIESNTKICNNSNEAINEVQILRKKLKEIGSEIGYSIGISGTHPTAKPSDQTFVNSEGYNWVSDQLSYYARRNITFALHVHIAVPNAELSISSVNALRRWIPPLLALSTNSPFFEGELTGMKSSRTFQFSTFPRTNIPNTFKDYDEFTDLVQKFILTKTINKPRQIWWKIRPHLEYGTIEFRMIDVQRSLKNTHMFIALLQALTRTAVLDKKNNNLIEDLSLEILNDGLWKASRFDFDIEVIDSGDNDILSMKDFVNKMLSYCNDSLVYFNNESISSEVNNILLNGTEGDNQIKIYNKYGIEELKLFLINDVQYNLI